MRRNRVSVPIVILTAGGDQDIVQGLEAGANDFVSKPFEFAVPLARIGAQLRSYEHSERAVFQLGRYELRPANKLLVDADRKRKIRLTEKEIDILKYLYRAGGRPVSREELLAEVWGYNDRVTTHTLETHIYRLRQKMEADPAQCADAGDRGPRISADALTAEAV